MLTTPEEFANFDDTIAATELDDESVLDMEREIKEPFELESDEEDSDDSQL